MPSLGLGLGIERKAKVTPFNPADYGDATLWLRREALASLSNGDRITTFPDSTDYGNDATQATEARKQYWDESGVWRANSFENQCVVTPEIISGQSFTIFVVATVQLPTTGDGDTYDALIGFNAQGEADGGGVFMKDTGVSGLCKTAVYLTNGGGFDSYDGSGALSYASSSTFRVFEIVSTGGGTLSVYCDGVLDGSCSVGVTRHFTGKLTIGTGPQVGADRGYPGAYREVLVFDEALSSDNRAEVRAYLTRRAAISKARWIYPTWTNSTTGALRLVEAWPGGLVGAERSVTFAPASVIGTGDYALRMVGSTAFLFYSNTRVWLSNTQTLGVASCPNLFASPAVFTELDPIDASEAPGPNYHCAAPEPFLDSDGTVYVIFQGIDEEGENFQFYIVEALDATMQSWSEPVAITWDGTPPPLIDPFLMKKDGLYVLWYKKESAAWAIEVATAPDIYGPYTRIKSGDWAGWGTGSEGASVVQLADGTNRILLDDASGGGNGMFSSVSADSSFDGPWSTLKAVGFFLGGSGKPRHCTPVQVTAP